MRISRILLLLTPLALVGCVTVHRDAPPAEHTTVVLPPGTTTTVQPGSTTTVVCSNGALPPCN
jgi:hypothetical protein